VNASHETVVDCPECQGEGVTHHDCGEDSCCCADPEPNVRCRVCDGRGVVAVGDEGEEPGSSENVAGV
jgi:hypothetical protein